MQPSRAVSAAIERYRERLRARFGGRVREVVLFGSHARGEAHEDSDADVFVVVDAITAAERSEAIDDAFVADAATSFPVGLAPLVYSEVEAARARAGGRRLLRDIDNRERGSMNDDERRAAIAAEVSRGETSLAAGEKLLDGFPADAVSRAYYAAFHHARALLVSVGLEPTTHAGLTRLFQRDFVRTGRFDPKLASALDHLLAARQGADYTAEVVITDEMAKDEIESARRFVAACRACLVADGWL
ncbi:MAG: HEPN domain-containing protein [Labilithrix sp.]|nr:HEPN domain-containing protein [Labilithrix sp.]MCW5812048.1 HEPN domain-containing protein [Labilithrix sp.]